MTQKKTKEQNVNAEYKYMTGHRIDKLVKFSYRKITQNRKEMPKLKFHQK